jgi:hypothetical protein
VEHENGQWSIFGWTYAGINPTARRKKDNGMKMDEKNKTEIEKKRKEKGKTEKQRKEKRKKEKRKKPKKLP